jgi:hypothetical protein
MTLPQLLTYVPQVQAAFAAQGIQISVGQMLAIYQALAPLASSQAPAPTPTTPTIPLTLTLGADADLAPYGVALIGFSPQQHQGADLRDPGNAKYIAYAYLVANKIAPSSTWATPAVAVLAAAVPGVAWTAADGETLVYGDEFIHTAPRGHGDPGLTNRADLNPLEFFWGAIGS